MTMLRVSIEIWRGSRVNACAGAAEASIDTDQESHQEARCAHHPYRLSSSLTNESAKGTHERAGALVVGVRGVMGGRTLMASASAATTAGQADVGRRLSTFSRMFDGSTPAGSDCDSWPRNTAPATA